MRHRFPPLAKMASVLTGTAIGLGLFHYAGTEAAQAAPPFASGLGSTASDITQARVYRRGRPPIYPYYYNPGRPGGYSFYFGFVPYAKGNIENQAIQRGQYPQNIEWPPGLYGGPRPGWGPKASD